MYSNCFNEDHNQLMFNTVWSLLKLQVFLKRQCFSVLVRVYQCAQQRFSVCLSLSVRKVKTSEFFGAISTFQYFSKIISAYSKKCQCFSKFISTVSSLSVLL